MGATHDYIFRFYRVADPGLARIIRNLKLAIKKHPHLCEQSLRNEKIFVVRGCEPSAERLPAMPSEILESELHARCGPRSSPASVLDALGAVLSEQHESRSFVSVVAIAVAVRAMQVSPGLKEHVEVSETSEEDIDILIHGVLEEIGRTTIPQYTKHGKLAAEEGQGYLRAVGEILHGHLDGGMTDHSFYEVLKREMPELSKVDYRRKQRRVLEYLVRTAKHLVKERVNGA
jgi:hypothetical protein